MTAFLSMRLLPYFLYAILARVRRLRTRLCLSVAYLAILSLACTLGASTALLLLGLWCVYYLLAGFGTNTLRRFLATRRLTGGAVFVISVFVFVLLPDVALPGTAGPAVLAIGCELALKAHSYVVETSRPRARTTSLTDTLFFLFVDPTLLYTVRGRPTTIDAGLAGWARAGAGVVLLFLTYTFLWPVGGYLRASALPPFLGSSLGLMLYGVVRLLGTYAAHSSVASIDIGLMRELGWIVPERYRFPLLATSPMDFWRRWNIYVRMWLEAYIFLPLARRVALKTRSRAGAVIAVLATLAVSALIHDVFAFAAHRRMIDLRRPTAFFVAAILFVTVWAGAISVGEGIRPRIPLKPSAQLDRAVRLFGWLSVTGALVGAAMAWG
jgi:hypothetical protein